MEIALSHMRERERKREYSRERTVRTETETLQHRAAIILFRRKVKRAEPAVQWRQRRNRHCESPPLLFIGIQTFPGISRQ